MPWLFLLAAWLLVLVAAAAGYAAWSRTGLRMHLAVHSNRPAPGSPAEQLPEHVLRRSPVAVPVFEGDGLELEVGLDNSGGVRGPAWVAGEVAGKQVMFATGVVSRAGWRRLRVLGEVPRGPIDSTDWAIGTGDPFGFFAARRGCPDAEVALVLPRFTSIAGRWEAREVEAAVAAPRAGSGNELFGIREYRPGDSLRRIHWRSSARHGELVVREYEPPGVRTLRIVVDPGPPSDDVADQIARIAASEAWDCVKDGGRVVLSGPGLEPTRPERDVWPLLEWLARYPDPPSGPYGATFPARGAGRTEFVVVTANPDLLDAAAIRTWVVGDAAVDADVPFERVGTTWPL
ncbi:MAG TPA: DUF58 domain-containing protein [Candidatus Dormibacteraeota bacterium]